jgi:hypothetical protein
MTVPFQGPPRPSDPRGAAPQAVEPRAAVAAAMAGLDGLADRPLAEHVEAYERVHAALGDALAAGSA